MNKCSRLEEMIKNENIGIDLEIDNFDSDLSGHISGCSDCGSLLADLRSVSDKIKSLPKIEVSSGFNEKLWSGIRQAEHLRSEKENEKVVPFLSRAFYYVSGVAAIVIAFIYVSSLGIFDINKNSNQPGTSGMPIASEYDQSNVKTVTDSLESLGKNITDDEELRLKVSTGE